MKHRIIITLILVISLLSFSRAHSFLKESNNNSIHSTLLESKTNTVQRALQEEEKPVEEESPVSEIFECYRDKDCQPQEICDRETSTCQLKGIFPLTLNELLGSISILIVVGVGQAAGVGGGLVVVPLLMSFFHFAAKKSIALVFVTIFSASLGNLFSYMKQKGKDGNPIIDYKIVTLSLPTIMIGSVYGVAFNKFLPQIVIAFMLLFFILMSGFKTFKSYKNQKNKEKLENIATQTALQRNQKANNQNSIELQPINQSTDAGDGQNLREPFIPSENKEARSLTSESIKQQPQPQQQQIQITEQFPKKLIKIIFGITLGFVIFSLSRGGKKFESLINIPPCGILYQLFNFAALLLSFYLVKMIVNSLTSPSKQVEQAQKSQSSEEMHKFANSAFFAGLIGSIVGIGGGMILVPKWLEFGIPAERTPACSITLLFLTAFNSLIQFSLAGAFKWDEFFYLSAIALLSSFLVSSAISDYVKRTNQNSLLILILVSFMLIALILFTELTIEQAMTNPESLFSFGEFC